MWGLHDVNIEYNVPWMEHCGDNSTGYKYGSNFALDDKINRSYNSVIMTFMNQMRSIRSRFGRKGRVGRTEQQIRASTGTGGYLLVTYHNGCFLTTSAILGHSKRTPRMWGKKKGSGPLVGATSTRSRRRNGPVLNLKRKRAGVRSDVPAKTRECGADEILGPEQQWISGAHHDQDSTGAGIAEQAVQGCAFASHLMLIIKSTGKVARRPG
jgi:hypothetical protein